MDVLHFGYCPYLGADSIAVKPLYIPAYRYTVLSDTERIAGVEHFISSDIEQIAGYRCLCISGH